jgi:Ca2+-binding RTX toxin-like protein
MTTATAAAETITNAHHTVQLFYFGGPVAFSSDEVQGVVPDLGGNFDVNDPYNQFVEVFDGVFDPNQRPEINTMFSIISSGGQPPIGHALSYYFEVFADTPADYSLSNASVFIDLTRTTQHGGFAEGDTLINVSEVIGSPFNDIIRGASVSDFPADSIPTFINGINTQSNQHFTINNPGDNLLIGGNGSDVLEGRGGADILMGGSFSGDFDLDFASYESSPAAVTVRLAGIGSDTTTGIATGGDAQGDILLGIEGLIGSTFNDTLIGNSLNNTLAGGLGDDFLDGRGGINTVDYSRDHFFDQNDTADKVVVHLGLHGANGTGAEFNATFGSGPPNVLTINYQQVSVDTLVSIENVTGTAGPDEIVGNEQANTLNGRGSNGTLDGGLGNDTLIGGADNDTASYASHDSLSGEFGTISLGPSDSVAGHANYFIQFVFNGFATTQNVETDTLFGIENITGSNLNETLIGNAGDNILDGGFGNDTLIGNGGHDTASFVSHDTGSVPLGESDTISLGLNGADGSFTRSLPSQVLESDVLRGITNVTGSNRSETINGNEQDNILAGRGGSDTINGGLGNDTYDFRGPGQGSDRFFDTGGTDKVLIDSIDDILFSKRVNNEHDLQITVKSGTSTSTFTVVNQFAGSPIETVVDASGKSMVLATGFLGGDLPGIISGTSGDDFMDGRGGDDFLFGNGGNDHMLGGTGNDRLDGGEGNDVLDGGPGDDILTGGKGHDTFVFAPMTRNTPGSGNDVVTDFVHGQDHLDLRAFDTSFRALKTEDGHGEHGQGHHAEDDDRITMHVDGHDTLLEFAGGSVRITGITQLHADDFFFEKSSSSFTGTVAGLSGQDAIDFVDTGFGASSTPGSSGNAGNSGGTLPVGDGVHMANIALLGSYMASSFAAASGGQGGTLISEAAQASTHTPIVTQPHA